MNQFNLCYLFNLNQFNIISYCRLNKFLLNQRITWEQTVQPTYVRSIRHIGKVKLMYAPEEVLIGPKRELICNSNNSITLMLNEGEWSTTRSSCFTPDKSPVIIV